MIDNKVFTIKYLTGLFYFAEQNDYLPVSIWFWSYDTLYWPPDAKSLLIRKDPDAGKDWRQDKKGTREDELVDGITDSMDIHLSKLWEMVKDTEAWRATVSEITKSQLFA